MLDFNLANLTIWAVPVGFLLFADALFGSIAAWIAPGGAFQWGWLYVFARTKGLAYVLGLMLLTLGELSPDLKVVGAPIDFFTISGVGFLSPLGISLIASIGDNIKKMQTGLGDPTTPTGVDTPTVVTGSTDPVPWDES